MSQQGQSKRLSAVECLFDVSLGILVSVLSYLTILPVLGFEASLSISVTLTLYFSAISLVRKYFCRRFFESMVRREPE